MEKFKSVMMNNFTDKPYIGNRDKVKPKKNEVLVKILRSTVNPSDFYFLQGQYGLFNPKKFPITPGFEASGIIEEVGEDVSKDLVGKYCSIGVSVTNPNEQFFGVWSEYVYVNPKSLVIYESNVNLDIACFAFVNPLTALSFIEIVKSKKLKTIAQNASCSALGLIMIKLCKENEIELINIVRKEDQVKQLGKLGCQNIINTSEKGWEKKFTLLSKSKECRLLFDCVGGPLTKKLFSLLPLHSTIIHYGNLEAKSLEGFESGDFIFGNKKLEGFWLSHYLSSIDSKTRNGIFNRLKKDIESNSDFYKPNIAKEVNLEGLLESLPEYTKLSSLGKILIKPKF